MSDINIWEYAIWLKLLITLIFSPNYPRHIDSKNLLFDIRIFELFFLNLSDFLTKFSPLFSSHSYQM